MRKEVDVNESNRVRFRALLDIMGVSISVAAKVIGVSRPLLSRVLGGDDRVDTARVWALCEMALPQIVALRSKAFLDLQGAPVEGVQAVQRQTSQGGTGERR